MPPAPPALLLATRGHVHRAAAVQIAALRTTPSGRLKHVADALAALVTQALHALEWHAYAAQARAEGYADGYAAAERDALATRPTDRPPPPEGTTGGGALPPPGS